MCGNQVLSSQRRWRGVTTWSGGENGMVDESYVCISGLNRGGIGVTMKKYKRSIIHYGMINVLTIDYVLIKMHAEWGRNDSRM